MGAQPSILVVDDNAGVRDVIAEYFSMRGYECRTAESGRRAMALFRESPFDVVISDVNMGDMNGLEVTQNVLSASPETAVILMTGHAEVEAAIQAIRLGSSDFLLKPFDFKTVENSVLEAFQKKQGFRHRELQLESLRQRLQELLCQNQNVVASAMESFCKVLEMRDIETFAHVRRVRNYAGLLAQALHLSSLEEENIRIGALLHDVGKVVVPDRILFKPGPLTEGEWLLMREHVGAGYRIVSGIPGLEEAAQLVLQHHERYDGGGYPEGIRGEQIGIGARIFALADTYDAMTQNRPYRKQQSDEVAREEILTHSGRQFDPKIVEAFFRIPKREWMRAGRIAEDKGSPGKGDGNRAAAKNLLDFSLQSR